MRHVFIAIFLAAVPVTALHAQAMPVSKFLAKADALKKKGPLALFSSDIGLLKKEVQNSALELRKERLAAKAAGRKPTFCPPEAGGSLNSNELLKHFQSIPPDQRGMSVKTALAGLMQKRYPCPA